MAKQFAAVPDVFSYEYFEKNRYTISEYNNYESLCNNGFIKLYTIPTRVYWHTQNQFEHRTPDWKFHVSVKHQDLKKAWNLLVGLFLKMKCRAGMKTIYLKQSQGSQKGRQITIYIVKIDDLYERSAFAGDFDLSVADEHSDDFWIQFVLKIEALLEENQIETNGLADGDLKIGEYVSLRNQSFVLDQKGNFIYPPNEKGWNPNQHDLPFDFRKLTKTLYPKMKIRRPLYYFMVPVFVVSAGLLLFHNKHHHQIS